MTYKNKLFIVLIGLALVTNGLLFILLYVEAKKDLLVQIEVIARGIANATAATLDGEQLKKLQSRKDEQSQLYKQIEGKLRKIRDRNRTTYCYVKYIYTLTPSKKTNQVLFGVDAEENDADKSHIGDVYNFLSKNKNTFRFDGMPTSTSFLNDAWGSWLTATAPVYDKAGKVVSLVGVDLRASDIYAKIKQLIITDLVALFISLFLALLVAYFMSKYFTGPLTKICTALGQIGKGDLDTKVEIKTHDEFADVGIAINKMTEGLRQRDNLKLSLARYVSNQVAETIINTGQLPEVQGTRLKITVLFCDVRNFTTLAEKLSPEEVVAILNEVFEAMIDAIFKHQGMLDKFLGDGFMAIFGAPLPDEAQEQHAVQAALNMQNTLKTLGQKWQAELGVEIRMGIGINTGIAIVGNIGSKQRMEYTAIGDTVNLASRLETATKNFGSRILVSEDTYKAVSQLFTFKELGSIKVKGRTKPVIIYEVDDE